MGANKQEFIDVRMQMEVYNSIEQEKREQMEIRNVFESGWDEEFKKHASYNRLKKESTQKYKELKEIEHIIKNK